MWPFTNDWDWLGYMFLTWEVSKYVCRYRINPTIYEIHPQSPIFDPSAPPHITEKLRGPLIMPEYRSKLYSSSSSCPPAIHMDKSRHNIAHVQNQLITSQAEASEFSALQILAQFVSII